MRSSRPPRGGTVPAALATLRRATHLFRLALGSALGKLRDTGMTAARMFERAEESALLLRMMREAAGILGARWARTRERRRWVAVRACHGTCHAASASSLLACRLLPA